jgi:hypothetical protein
LTRAAKQTPRKPAAGNGRAHRNGRALELGPPSVVQRTGGAYSLVHAFRLLDISPSHGHKLISDGVIKTVRLSTGTPRITDKEIARLLGEEPA